MQCEAFPGKGVATEAPQCSRDSSVHGLDFSELVRLHWGLVFRICLHITRDQHDAEDAAQDCFLRAFSHLSQFQGKAQISTWLSSIAKNSSLMLLRKRRRRQEVEIQNSPDSNGDLPMLDPTDSKPNQLSRVLYSENCDLLDKAIAALPIRLRAVADLFIFSELNLQEIGRILNISNTSAKSRLYRARRRLSRFEKLWFKANIAHQ